MEHSSIFWTTVLWVIVWGAIGGVVTPRIYLRRDLDISQASLVGAAIGAATGPIGLLPLWYFTPALTPRWAIIPGIIIIGIIVVAFARADPENLCVTSGSFVASQLTNGIVIGIIYGLMALGLTLIFSILGVVSFAHGEFYMIGGMLVYYISAEWFPGSNPIIAILGACLITFLIGVIFERIFLQPMYTGAVERPGEYAILVTFGLAFFLQYFVQATAGANPVKAQRFFDFPDINLPSADAPTLLQTTAGNMRLFDAVSIPNPRFTAALIAIIMLILLLIFLYRTWVGKALRAVSQDRQAAAVAGINPANMNTLAFGLGGMLAGLSGATLVQVFSWLPQVGTLASSRAFVIIVLGGMGSLPGAFLGGLLVGLFEAAGTGCIPDPTRAASYIPAYGMIILTLVLLLKPTGFFGREL
ncbi:MAG: branched-chain amino acid ABC transporter permease [Anaerolineales bacterium]|nr:branched-chain amino acid ABC transporter permease [Anaerolineales bacterium]